MNLSKPLALPSSRSASMRSSRRSKSAKAFSARSKLEALGGGSEGRGAVIALPAADQDVEATVFHIERETELVVAAHLPFQLFSSSALNSGSILSSGSSRSVICAALIACKPGIGTRPLQRQARHIR